MDFGSHVVVILAIFGTVASKIDGGWDTQPNTQYHIQTDEGPERYFKYQTISGQYRKERRLQDGSVVGTYGWVDADGYLRLNDYVADSKGYRIVKNKKLFVGAQAPVGQAVAAAKYAPAVAGTGVSVSPSPPTPYHHREAAVTRAPPSRPQQSSWRGSPFVYPSDSQSSPLLFPSSSTASPPPARAATSSHYQRPQPISAADAVAASPHYRRPQPISAADASPHYRRPPQPISAADASTASTTTAAADYYSVRPVDVNSIAATADGGGEVEIPYRRRSSSSAAEQPLYEQPLRPHTFRPAYRKVVDLASETATPEAQYDGVSFVRNGFKYYLPRHYHEEQSDASGDTRAGSFGYVDPFGIRRVVYYNASPGTGFVHRKNNRYVGLNAEPYDPRPQ